MQRPSTSKDRPRLPRFVTGPMRMLYRWWRLQIVRIQRTLTVLRRTDNGNKQRSFIDERRNARSTGGPRV